MPRKSIEEKRAADRIRKQQQRTDAAYRANEKGKDAAARRLKRQSQAVREAEKQMNTTARKEKRSNPEVQVAEKERNTTARKAKRSNPEVRVGEQERNTTARKAKRSNPEVRVGEQERDTTARKVKRSNPEVQVAEQEINTSARKAKRSKLDVKIAEQKINTPSRSALRKKQSEEKKANDRKTNTTAITARRRLFVENIHSLKHKFHEEIRHTFVHVCSCCGGLFLRSGVSKVSKEILQARGCDEELIKEVLFIETEHHLLCHTCKRSAFGTKHVKPRLHKLALANGHDFPPTPAVLIGLSPLEERLVALRLAFMQIRARGIEEQSVLRGNIVNIENDLDECARVLPREFNETSVVEVELMRQMSNTRPMWKERIRPFRVYQAAKYLVNTELYQSENVVLSDRWSGFKPEDEVEFTTDVANPMNFLSTDSNSGPEEGDTAEDEEEGDDDEDTDNINIAAEETLVYDHEAAFHVHRIAPGEGKIPRPFFLDQLAEYGTFPTIYAGVRKKIREGVKVSLTDVYKSELRNRRRLAAKPTKILYMFRRSFNDKVKSAVRVCLRKLSRQTKVTASDALNPAFVQRICRVDEGYAVFKNVRGTPAYWQQKSKDVMAMMRQLGSCTFFVTLSAAETKWAELLVMLMQVLKNETISEEEAKSIPFATVCELIRSDPATCMRHFDHRYRALLRLLLKPKEGIFAPHGLIDFFQRVEFQMRGSPHSHGLYWVADAPNYKDEDEDSAQLCCEFADKYITCERDESDEMEELIGLQIHRHNGRACRRQRKNETYSCRFRFPRPPMKKTCILLPLPIDMPEEEKVTCKENFSRIHGHLEKWGRNFKEDLAWDKFLQELQLNENEYILAIRSTLKRATMLMRRKTNAIYVNNYNRELLLSWRANMDIQFVLNTYACAKYCVSYVVKSESGVSKLLQAIEKKAKKENWTFPQKTNEMAKCLMTGSEASAQEAAGFIFGLASTLSSRDTIFVSSSPSSERIRMLKSKKELKEISEKDKDSEDIFANGVIERYIDRPRALEDICLADFATGYKTRKKNPEDSADVEEDDEVETDDEYDNADDFPLDQKTKLRVRSHRLILRFRHYSKAKEPVNAAREMLMLFLPWRNEELQLNLSADDILQKVKDNEEEIKNNSEPFFYDRTFDADYIQSLYESAQLECLVEEEHAAFDKCLDTEASEFAETELQEGARKKSEKFLSPDLLPDDEYRSLMRSLNDKQDRFVMHVLNRLKTNHLPFQYFLSGGAGVGKSQCVKAIVQSFLRHEKLKESLTPEDLCVLVSAPTGKAAFNVNGMTLHSTFHLPPTQRPGMAPKLDESILNTLRCKLRGVKLIIIDEVSMVSVKMLYDIDARLRQIFATKEDFGGKSVLVVGHLRQLPPVLAKHVFSKPSHVRNGAMCNNYLWEKFKYFELDEVMRQTGDNAHKFCIALNNMAEGTMTTEDIDLISSRELHDFEYTGCEKTTSDVSPPLTATWLFYKNEDCDKFNTKVHTLLHTDGCISLAKDIVEGQASETHRKDFLDSAKTFNRQQADGLPYEVGLKVGGQFFITTNVDVEDGLFNGAAGRLRLIEYKNTATGREPKRAWMEFSDKIGVKSRKTTKAYQQRESIPDNWTAINPYTRTLTKRSSTDSALREQSKLYFRRRCEH